MMTPRITFLFDGRYLSGAKPPAQGVTVSSCPNPNRYSGAKPLQPDDIPTRDNDGKVVKTLVLWSEFFNAP